MALCWPSSGMTRAKAMREASSDGDVNVFPPGTLDQVASPVTRWLGRTMRASFLMSKWISSPGVAALGCGAREVADQAAQGDEAGGGAGCARRLFLKGR